MKRNLILLLACLATQIALGETSLAEKNAAENAAIKKEWESWNAPFPPFRLIGNIHYVGASGISSFLIATPEGTSSLHSAPSNNPGWSISRTRTGE